MPAGVVILETQYRFCLPIVMTSPPTHPSQYQKPGRRLFTCKGNSEKFPHLSRIFVTSQYISTIKRKTKQRTSYTNITRVSPFLRFSQMKKNSPSGNRTPVPRVTGGDTHHYTNEDPPAGQGQDEEGPSGRIQHVWATLFLRYTTGSS